MQGLAQSIKQAQGDKDRLLTIGREHAFALLFYFVLSVALSWPLIRDFTTRLIGLGGADPKHSVWMLWHVQLWASFKEPLFSTLLLYYPRGISTLLDGVGPLSGIIALPFWGWGPIAAYNGTVLIGLWLSGYCMYLLARDFDLEPAVALFAGMLFQLMPIHVAGTFSHLEKTFTGLLPLTLLAVHRALNPRRSPWWTVVTALTLLLTALYSGYQFIYAALGVGFFLAAEFITVEASARWKLFQRSALLAMSGAVLVGPLLVAIIAAESDPSVGRNIQVNVQSTYYAPDLIQFFLPNFYSVVWHLILSTPTLIAPFQSLIRGPNDRTWVGIVSIETPITLSWIGMLLCAIALIRGSKSARRWLLFLSLFALLALGPSLRVFGRTRFTPLNLSIILPYALLTSLPGLNFMRVSGRFMMMGAVGFSLAAGIGLAWLFQRWHRQRYLILSGAMILLLIESWPMPWPQSSLPRVPEFYARIAQDSEAYAVLDLPFAIDKDWPIYASAYQMYQMTHHKPIAWGYLSHVYDRNPLPVIESLLEAKTDQPDILLNGGPADPYANAQFELSKAGYRYVVWHKVVPGAKPSADKVRTTQAIIAAIFGPNASPLVEDDLVRVYRLAPFTDDANLVPSIKLASNWRGSVSGGRWATSPATLEVDSPRPQNAVLQITPAYTYDPQSKNGIGTKGVLLIRVGDSAPTFVDIEAGRTTGVPVQLMAGSQTITLSLQAGNFQPAKYGWPDPGTLSFGIHSINLETSAP